MCLKAPKDERFCRFIPAFLVHEKATMGEFLKMQRYPFLTFIVKDGRFYESIIAHGFCGKRAGGTSIRNFSWLPQSIFRFGKRF